MPRITTLLLIGSSLFSLLTTGCNKPESDVKKELIERPAEKASSGPLQQAGLKPLVNLDDKIDDAANLGNKKLHDKKLNEEQESQ
jgi:hypothetical protein